MIARRGRVIKTDGLELPPGHIAEILGKTGLEKPAQWEEQAQGH